MCARFLHSVSGRLRGVIFCEGLNRCRTFEQLSSCLGELTPPPLGKLWCLLLSRDYKYLRFRSIFCLLSDENRAAWERKKPQAVPKIIVLSGAKRSLVRRPCLCVKTTHIYSGVVDLNETKLKLNFVIFWTLTSLRRLIISP